MIDKARVKRDIAAQAYTPASVSRRAPPAYGTTAPAGPAYSPPSLHDGPAPDAPMATGTVANDTYAAPAAYNTPKPSTPYPLAATLDMPLDATKARPGVAPAETPGKWVYVIVLIAGVYLLTNGD